MARLHLSSQKSKGASMMSSSNPHADYVILSVKYISLCHINDSGSLQYTAPEHLFNGDSETSPPSDLALDYLLWATASARPSISTPLRLLPGEVQAIILSYGSAGCGTVVAAKVSCILGLGPPFG